jgi:opacity protein-like surface antigen
MKKFTSALLAVTALTAANVFAAGAVDSKTGAYVGGNVGMANTNVKYSFTNVGSAATASGPGTMATGATITEGSTNAQKQSLSAGKMNPLFGLFAGYGMQVGTMYFGGEVYGAFDSAKVETYNDSGSGQGSATGTGSGAYYPLGKASVKRTSFYGLAGRLGFMANPNTLVYVKLGVEGGKWTATQTSATNDRYAPNIVTKASKNSISFVPGLGVDAFITKNLFLRAEYTYLFGPKITLKQNTAASGSWGGDAAWHKFQITQQTFKVGVGYKF